MEVCMVKIDRKKTAGESISLMERIRNIYLVSPSVNKDTFYRKIKCYSVYDSMWNKNMLWSENEMAYCSNM